MQKPNFLNVLLIIPFLFSGLLFAQNPEGEKIELVGNLHVDSKLILDSYQPLEANFKLNDQPGQKSPVLAGVMSAVLPGSGELYAGEYLKAAIFFAVEAALVTTAVVYNNKGDNGTAEFEAFADEHWSVVKYSEYLLDNKAKLGIPEDCDIPINPDESLPPWERIEDWDALNRCESIFPHQLAHYGEQQYYEEIGKYGSFSSGWDDFKSGDPFRYITSRMKYYSQMRGQANDYYNIADKAIIGLYINHLLSAVDAVWSATVHNKDLSVKMRVQNVYLADRVEWVPTLNLRYNF